MLLAEPAVLVHFNSVRIVLLVLLGVVVALFALSTRKGNFNSHFRHLLFLPFWALASLFASDFFFGRVYCELKKCTKNKPLMRYYNHNTL